MALPNITIPESRSLLSTLSVEARFFVMKATAVVIASQDEWVPARIQDPTTQDFVVRGTTSVCDFLKPDIALYLILDFALTNRTLVYPQKNMNYYIMRQKLCPIILMSTSWKKVNINSNKCVKNIIYCFFTLQLRLISWSITHWCIIQII